LAQTSTKSNCEYDIDDNNLEHLKKYIRLY